MEEERDLYSRWLFTRGFDVLSTPRGRVALWLLQRHHVEFIVLQSQLHDMSALGFLRRLRSHSSTTEVPVVVLVDTIDMTIDRALRKAGASAILQNLGNFGYLERTVDGLRRQSRRRLN